MQQDIDPNSFIAKKTATLNLVPFGLFLIINGLICWTWYRELAQLEQHISPFNVLLWGLAVFRIANIVADEPVTRAIRAPFVEQEAKEGGRIEETPKKRGLQHTIGSLLYCSSCVGVWVAAGITYMMVFFPLVAWVVIVIFAISGLERILASLVATLARGEK